MKFALGKDPLYITAVGHFKYHIRSVVLFISDKGAFLYYLRVFWVFLEPSTPY